MLTMCLNKMISYLIPKRFLTISNYYMYTAFQLYVHKLQTKGGETMIIIIRKQTGSKYFKKKHQLFIISEIKEVINIY